MECNSCNLLGFPVLSNALNIYMHSPSICLLKGSLTSILLDGHGFTATAKATSLQLMPCCSLAHPRTLSCVLDFTIRWKFKAEHMQDEHGTAAWWWPYNLPSQSMPPCSAPTGSFRHPSFSLAPALRHFSLTSAYQLQPTLGREAVWSLQIKSCK